MQDTCHQQLRNRGQIRSLIFNRLNSRFFIDRNRIDRFISVYILLKCILDKRGEEGADKIARGSVLRQRGVLDYTD